MTVAFPHFTLNCSDCRTHFIHLALTIQMNINLEEGSTFWAPRTKNGPIRFKHVENNLIYKWIRYEYARKSLSIDDWVQLDDALQVFIAGLSSQPRCWRKPHLASLASVKTRQAKDSLMDAFILLWENRVQKRSSFDATGLHSTPPPPLFEMLFTAREGHSCHFGSLSLSL